MICKKIAILFILVFTLACSLKKAKETNIAVFKSDSKEPLFVNSIASTNIDFIKSSDPDTFVNISFWKV